MSVEKGYRVTTKAAVLGKLNEPLVVEELEVPYLDVGQVLVKVHTTTICGKQMGEMSGWYGPDRFLPHLLGHEGGGVVEETGPGVICVNKGDHVVMHWRKGIGIDSRTPIRYKRKDGSFVGAGPIATFTEYAVVSENRLTVVPRDIPFYVASLMGCAVTTALGLVNNEANLKIGQSIVIIGCGGVGQNIIRAARMVSANPIVAIDRLSSKLGMATISGATHVFNNNADFHFGDAGRILDKGVDVVVECTGIPSLVASALSIASSEGKVILLVPPESGEKMEWPLMGNRKVSMSLGGKTNPTEDIPRYARLWMDGRLDLDGIITDSFTLDEINSAVDLMKTGKCGRCVIEF